MPRHEKAYYGFMSYFTKGIYMLSLLPAMFSRCFELKPDESGDLKDQ